MQLTLDDIQAYSQCPRQYAFRKNAGLGMQSSKYRYIIREIIKQCYINRTQHNYDPQWETIKTRINKFYFENIDVSRKEIFEPVYRESIATMGTLHYWYYKIFNEDVRTGIVNVPVSLPVSNSILTTIIDVVLLDKQYGPVPIVFDNDKIIPNQLSTNIKFKSLFFMLSKELQVPVTVCEYGIITEQTVKYQKVFNKSAIDTIEKYVNFIVRGIENKIFYPSVNEQCNHCSFQQICVL